jgi:hypothetical protein
MTAKQWMRISLMFPFLSAAFVFVYRNWLNSEVCIQNILHHSLGLGTLLQSKEWAEPYTMCIDPYWVNQWLKNYGAGVAKRGLLGTLASSAFDGRINLLTFNIVAFLMILLIVYGTVYCLCHLGKSGSLVESCVFTSLLWLTPAGKAISETAGDPLQAVLILLLAAVLAIHHLGKKDVICDAILASFFSVAILIHEGSFILFLPAYLFIGRRRWPWWVGLGVGIAITVYFSKGEDPGLQAIISSNLTGYNPFTGLELQYRAGEGLAPNASFAYNLSMEFSRYLQDPAQTFGQLYRTFFLTLFLALCVAIWIQGFSRTLGNRYLKLWFLYLPLTLPFFLITHDWVRYGVINLFSCLYCLAAICHYQGESPYTAQLSGGSKLQSYHALKRSLPWAALMVATLVFGPHANQKDIRTFPPDRLGLKITLLASAAIVIATRNNRGVWQEDPAVDR